MTYTVSITSQGQISIPAPIRRKLGMNKFRKALVTEKEGRVTIEPFRDFLELQGSVKTDKKITSRQIREGFEEYLSRRSAGKK